ncbi:hypothetical protein B0H14DRAFT_2588793 [Mycena olivaceomarginata]|nr:hypothetical protein B0H14DRAFT_2588793 [Mycena olivaceomarginata]
MKLINRTEGLTVEWHARLWVVVGANKSCWDGQDTAFLTLVNDDERKELADKEQAFKEETKLKSWFSNQKTKDKGRKVEPFWLYQQKYNVNTDEEEQESEKEDGAGEKEEGDDNEGDGKGGSSISALNHKYTLAKQYLNKLSEKDREELEEMQQIRRGRWCTRG